jgi:hypothetical protein
MTSWESTETAALRNAGKSLKSVDSLLKYVSDTRGQPSASERALFAAAVVFLYGIWENYCEQLAIELGTRVANKCDPKDVPRDVRALLEKHSAWELSVHPGWRHLWSEEIKSTAVGDGDQKFGLNTAKMGQVSRMLKLVGIHEPFENIPFDIVPSHLRGADSNCSSAADAIDKLVELRGTIVHTGSVPDTLRKQHVREWRKFVEDITSKLDSECRKQCKNLVV